MKVLVTGRSGQIAQSLLALTAPDVDVIAIGRPDLDISHISSIERAIARERPDILVNAAAYTAVDRAEDDINAAYAANRDGAGHAAKAAASAGIPIIHLSTDYVFAGDKTSPYVETDQTGPASIYGRSKLEGEEAIEDACPAHVILRTAWVYSPYGENFLRTMLRLAATRDVVRVVDDQHGTPTYAPDIASGILSLAQHIFENPAPEPWRGIYNFVAAGYTTWAGFAEEIFQQSKLCGGKFAHVEKITTAEYPTRAARPKYSHLDTSKFQTVFQQQLPDWKDGIKRCIRVLHA
jgi:dTDP-4-dehydrorhamnose reductase